MALALAAGFGGGAVAGPALHAAVAEAIRRPAPRAAEPPPDADRETDPAQRRADSARAADLARAWESRRPPREVRRVQALDQCAVSFEIRDTNWRALPLFTAAARDRRRPGAVVARGYAYRDRGFDAGDTATVLLPDVWCADLLVGSVGGSAVGPPPTLHPRRR